MLERLPTPQRDAERRLHCGFTRCIGLTNATQRSGRLHSHRRQSFSVKIRPTETRHTEIKAHCIQTSATSAGTARETNMKDILAPPTFVISSGFYFSQCGRNVLQHCLINRSSLVCHNKAKAKKRLQSCPLLDRKQVVQNDNGTLSRLCQHVAHEFLPCVHSLAESM